MAGHRNDAQDLRAIEMVSFEKRFFAALAEATDNRFYILRRAGGSSSRRCAPPGPRAFSDEQRQEFYRQIGARLVDDREAARFYLDALSPHLDMLGSFVLMGGSSAR